ncbi:glycosyltransferase family 8 protein [Sedimentibacter hydroxybenzoicus DSM 7310]|uniref:Glycosyltransferase family 8 protein n=1 Tax=Sedimentibacter hydroxybenzoicus DSM 7310 TaxID=1123245 RepID=A0A974BLS7_SEDHY|nr:glycosyltransferase family 8 protein [Sedimentibacter hydroxybenzoicus]NYB75313.1 glycosyltransferase family 8 protein [Sedimentibacter hydroxybenzoicus DSM 7310]
MNILVTLNSNYIEQLIVMLTSLIKSDDNEKFEVYIVHSSLDEDDLILIVNSVCIDRCKITDVKIPEGMFDEAPVTYRYPKEMYYRIFAAQYLPESVDRILYLDPDIVIINRISGLYNMDMGDNFFAAASHVSKSLKKINELRLDMPEDSTYINSGVMLLNLQELRKSQNIREVYDYIENKKAFFLLPDQDVINGVYADRTVHVDAMIYNLSDRYLYLYNANPKNISTKRDMRWIANNTSIIHYCGRNKPWKNNYKGELGVFYYYFENLVNRKICAME